MPAASAAIGTAMSMKQDTMASGCSTAMAASVSAT